MRNKAVELRRMPQRVVSIVGSRRGTPEIGLGKRTREEEISVDVEVVVIRPEKIVVRPEIFFPKRFFLL